MTSREYCIPSAVKLIKKGCLHFEQDETKAIPEDMIQSIIKAKNCDTGLLNLRQAFFGTFDMACHTSTSKVRLFLFLCA